MYKICFSIFVVLLKVITYVQDRNVKFWYKQPANDKVKDNFDSWNIEPLWLKALLVGNGHIGATVLDDVNGNMCSC